MTEKQKQYIQNYILTQRKRIELIEDNIKYIESKGEEAYTFIRKGQELLNLHDLYKLYLAGDVKKEETLKKIWKK